MPLDKETIKKAYNEDSLDFLQKIKLILFKPKEFFDKIKAEKGMKAPLFYYLIMLVIGTAESLLISSHSTAPFTSLGQLGLTKNVYLDVLLSTAIALVMAFIIVGVVHLFARLFKGQGNYSDTFRAYAYSITPYSLFSIPLALIVFVAGKENIAVSLIGLVILLALGLWSLWLEYKILSALHKISEWKAFFAIILPIIIVYVAMTFVVFLFISQTRLAEIESKSGTSQMNETLGQMTQKVWIDSAGKTSIAVRSIGTQPVALDRLSVYVDGNLKDCSWGTNTDLVPGSIVICTLPESCSGKTVKISAPGNTDETVCS